MRLFYFRSVRKNHTILVLHTSLAKTPTSLEQWVKMDFFFHSWLLNWWGGGGATGEFIPKSTPTVCFSEWQTKCLRFRSQRGRTGTLCLNKMTKHKVKRAFKNFHVSEQWAQGFQTSSGLGTPSPWTDKGQILGVCASLMPKVQREGAQNMLTVNKGPGTST